MRYLKLLSLSLGLLFILAACATNNIEEIQNAMNPDSTAVDTCGLDTITVSFATDIVPIMQMYCTPDFNANPNFICHGAGSQLGAWEDHAALNAAAESGALMNELQLRTMPPGFSTGPQTMTDCEIATVRSWVDNGSPDN